MIVQFSLPYLSDAPNKASILENAVLKLIYVCVLSYNTNLKTCTYTWCTKSHCLVLNIIIGIIVLKSQAVYWKFFIAQFL